MSNRVCRTCLSAADDCDSPMVDIYNTTCPSAKMSLCSILRYVSFVDISPSDGLPAEMCHNCVEKVSIAFDFKLLCERSSEILRAGRPPSSSELTNAETINDNDSTHLCPVCGKRFRSSSGLKQHLQYHRGVKPHACTLCDKRYLRPHLLREHMRLHTGERCAYACALCDKRFFAKSSLRSHIKRTHEGVAAPRKPQRARVFPCPHTVCPRHYATKESLELHLRHAHTRERPFACDSCDKSFCSRKRLAEHRRVHVADKPEECVLCATRFVNKQSLKKHMRLHTGERPYPCHLCDQRFLSSSRRSEHVQSKHMERRHECIVCRKRYHLNRTLVKHMRIHAGDASTTLINVANELLAPANDNKQNVPEPGFEVIV